MQAIFLTPFMLLSLSLSLLHAQDTKTEPQKKTTRTLRLLPVGDIPPFRQEIRDGVRIELDALPGTVPPRSVICSVAENNSPTTLSLGAVSSDIKIPNGALPLRISENNNSSAWHQCTLPELGNTLVILWRDPKKKTWEQAQSLVLSDSLTTFPDAHLRLINVCQGRVRVTLENQQKELAPGQIALIKPTNQTTPVQVTALGADQEWHRIFQSAVTQNPGERGQLIIYRADGEKPRMPLKVIMLREKTPPPPPTSPQNK